MVAEELRVDPSEVKVILADTGLVPDDGGTYASLTTPRNVPVIRRAAARARQLLPTLKKGEQLPGETPDEIEVTDPKDWKVCGKSLPRVGARELVTGKQKYAADHKASGMLYGKVLRAPAYTAELVACDTSAAEKVPPSISTYTGIDAKRALSSFGVVHRSDSRRAPSSPRRRTELTRCVGSAKR